MTITAEQIQALRQRHNAAVRQRASLEGRLEETERALESARAGLERDYGVSDLAALDALIASEQAALEADHAEAERLMAEAEAQARAVGA
jgi:predicted phage gp36 major capsid-like protein